MDRSTARDQRVEFRVLGPIEVRIDGLAVDIGGFRQRRLLALLLSRAGQVVETDALVEYVWDDVDRPDNAIEAARTYISRLRRSFSDAGLEASSLLVTQSPGYRLSLDDAEIDSDRFEHMVLRARSQLDGADAVSALVALDDALASWRGVPYQEFADRSWIEPEVGRLTELHRVAIEQRAAARLELGAHAEVVGELDQLVADQPLRARPVELLMLALYRSRRQAEALRVGSRYRRAVSDVGLDPPTSVTDLESRIAASDDELNPVLASTDTIRGYRLGEKLGEGAFSVVYRSVQPSLGREVAVKQIRAELADRPDFIRRFEAEAQTVAGLEHPHIVPLYDYWREPGSAYLVMRWLRGGTLESRLRRQRLDIEESVTLATQIGSALAAAHRAGVAHRDVRAANVFVDDIGNNYLGDFGIAVDTSGSQTNDGSDDVRGLGAVLFQSVTGTQPPAAVGNGHDHGSSNSNDHAFSAMRPDLPPAVEGVLMRAMVGAGDERFATVETFVDHYVSAMGLTTGRARATPTIPLAEDVTNPYKGLRAFRESDADDFRGRDRMVDRLLHQLAEPGAAGRLVAAVGPSGSGKSSLVRAGLLPRIRTGAIAGSDSWFITTMLPGQRPFDELEAAVNRIATAPTAGLVEVMRNDPNGITRTVNSVLPDETSELLLVIDQFEELFTLTDDPTRQAFLNGLVAAVTDDRSRLRVVITLRADHWHRPLQHPDLARLLETTAVTVTPMAADELERAITDPARRMGVTFEAGLVSDIIAEVHDQPGALPLMQYLLTELFDARDVGLMELGTYRRLGGVTGGLARRADELYEQSTDAEREGVRRLFSRLITPGEGVEDTRRRVLLSELSMVPDAVVDRFGIAQMLSFDHDPATREPTVEVAHEALIREWPRLRGWVDDDREGLRIMRHLTAASGEWDAAERPESELYRGGRLETTETWFTTHGADLTDVEQEFVGAAVRRRDRDAKVERRRVRRLRGLLAATSFIAVAALLAGAVAWDQQRRAKDNAQEAQAQRQAAEQLAESEGEALAAAEIALGEADAARRDADQARDEVIASAELEREAQEGRAAEVMIRQSASLRDDKPAVSLLLAREAYDRGPGPETLGALLTALQRTDGYLGSMPLTTVWNNDQWLGLLDDETVVVRTLDSIDVYDLDERKLVRSTPSTAPFKGGSVWVPAEGSTAAGRFATVDDAGNVLVIERGSVEPVVWLSATDGAVATSVAVGDDGSTVVGYENGDVELFTGRSARIPIQLVGHHRPVTFLAVNDDSSLVATQDDLANLTLWDVDTRSARWTITNGDPDRWRPDIPPKGPEGFQFGIVDGGPPTEQIDNRSAGSRLGGAIDFGMDGETLYWLFGGLQAINLVLHSRPPWTVALDGSTRQFHEMSPGRLVAGNQIIVDGEVTERLNALSPQTRPVVTSDNSTLVALDIERISIWSQTGDQLIARAFDREGNVIASLSRDGRQLAAFGFENAVISNAARVWDTSTRVATPVLPDGGNWIFFDNSDALVSFHSPEPRRAEIIDARTLAPTTPSVRLQGWTAIETSPDGSVVAIGQPEGVAITIHDAKTMDVVTTLQKPLPDDSVLPPYWIDFSPDGRLLAASTASAVAVWETAEWTTIDAIAPPPGKALSAIAFSPDSSQLAIRSNEGDLFLRDLSSATTRTVASGTVAGGAIYSVNTIEYTDDGRFVAIAGAKGGVSLVDVESGQILGIDAPALNSVLLYGAAVANGGRAAVSATDDHLIVWNLAPEEWPDIACRAAGRNLTLDEWEQFGWPGEPYHPTCDDWPPPA